VGAGVIQEGLHRLLESPIPQSWDAQLSNEPIVNLFYQDGRRLVQARAAGPLDSDLAAKGGAGLGKYYIGGNLGLIARLGYRLPDTYGALPIFGETQSLAGLPPPGREAFAFVSLQCQGFGILRWLPMDGNTFTDSPSLDRNSWALNVAVGLTVGYGRVALSYLQNGITGWTGWESFPGRSPDSFGTILFTVFLG